MPQQGTIFRALIASPSDCIQERKLIPEVIAEWNATHSLEVAAIVEPVMWETHSRPALGDRPQGIINQQLVSQCDLVIGAFWTRLGTPTGVAESGTAEEIEQFRSAGKPVLLYFSSLPVAPESLEPEQFAALKAYRKSLETQGLLARYDAPAELREILVRHLASTMIDLLKELGKAVPTQQESAEIIERNNAKEFKSDFERFLRKLRLEWSAERDGRPFNTDDAKWIMDRAGSEVLDFRSKIVEDKTGVADKLDQAFKDVQQLKRHRMYIDGGKSYEAFFAAGDAVIEVLESIPPILTKFIESDPAESSASSI